MIDARCRCEHVEDDRNARGTTTIGPDGVERTQHEDGNPQIGQHLFLAPSRHSLYSHCTRCAPNHTLKFQAMPWLVWQTVHDLKAKLNIRAAVDPFTLQEVGTGLRFGPLRSRSLPQSWYRPAGGTWPVPSRCTCDCEGARSRR